MLLRMLLSKKELEDINLLIGSRTAQWQYIVPKLMAHIRALERKAMKAKSVSADVGIINVKISAGKDKKLGTKDDLVKLSLASSKKKAAPKKRAATKKKKD